MLAQKIPEVFVSYFAEKIITRFGYKNMQLIALAAMALKFLLLSLLNIHNYYWAAILTETIHSLCLMMMLISSILMIKKLSP